MPISAFTVEDYTARLTRATRAAADKGLAGLLVTPGPDLTYLCGYRPTAITERLTLLVLAAGHDPVVVVPRLERPDAEAATGAGALRIVDWVDGVDPFALAAQYLRPDGGYAVSDSAWALHLLGLQRAAPGTSYHATTDALPMLRAVKDAHELDRLAAAGAAADATFERDPEGALRRAYRETRWPPTWPGCSRSTGTARSTSPSSAPDPNGANPHHEAGGRTIRDGDMVVLDFGGLKDGYGSDTTRTVHVGRRPPRRSGGSSTSSGEAQQAGFEAVGPAWPARRWTGRPGR